MKRSITEFFRTSGQKKLKQPDISDTVEAPELRISCAMPASYFFVKSSLSTVESSRLYNNIISR